MSQRILSIDVFRGLTIFLMVFVNDLIPVTEVPLWMKHADADANTMTFVDVVFPAFLFIVGISIPLAIQNRLSKGHSYWVIGKHILIRTIGLVTVGVFMVNSEEMMGDPSLISKSLWTVLVYISVILIWNSYPRDPGNKRNLYKGLQLLGVITLITLALIYPRSSEGQLIGMMSSWWGILGLIGWAYLYSSIVFLIFRKNLTAIVAMLALFILGPSASIMKD